MTGRTLRTEDLVLHSKFDLATTDCRRRKRFRYLALGTTSFRDVGVQDKKKKKRKNLSHHRPPIAENSKPNFARIHLKRSRTLRRSPTQAYNTPTNDRSAPRKSSQAFLISEKNYVAEEILNLFPILDTGNPHSFEIQNFPLHPALHHPLRVSVTNFSLSRFPPQQINTRTQNHLLA